MRNEEKNGAPDVAWGGARWGRRADEEPEDLEIPEAPWGRPSRSWPGGEPGEDDGEELDIVEEAVPFDKLPKAVREAVVEQCPGAGGFDPIKLTYGSYLCYNVMARRGRVAMSVTVSPQGEIMEFEVEVSPSRLPRAVRTALESRFSGLDFSRLCSVTMHFFEMQYEDEQGNRRIVQLDATGKVLADFEDPEGEDTP